MRKCVIKVNEEEINFLPTSPTISFSCRMSSIFKVSISCWQQCISPGHRSESHAQYMTQPTHCGPLTSLFTYPITFVGHPCSQGYELWTDGLVMTHVLLSNVGYRSMMALNTFVSCTSFILVAVWFASGAYNDHCEGHPKCHTMK
jgi:hypothetical protein